MNKFLLVCLICLGLMFTLMPAFASEPEDTTANYVDSQRGLYTTPNPALTDWLNNNSDFYHSHQIYLDQRRNPMGGGLDLVLFESQNPLLESITAETRYDINNEELSVFGVARVNVFKAVTNFLR